VAIQLQGNGGTVVEVGGTVFRAMHMHVKPIEYGALGHYRVTHRCLLAAAQAAASRVFEGRNTHASNLIVATRFMVRTVQSAAGTAQDNSLDVFRDTTFSAVDTTNTVTPTAIVKRTATMAAGPGSLAVRGVTATGVAAGMTGGTRTPDASPFAQHPISVQAAVQWPFNATDLLDDVNGTHPFVWAQNEGFEVQNRVLNVTTYGVMAYFDFSWAEVTAF